MKSGVAHKPRALFCPFGPGFYHFLPCSVPPTLVAFSDRREQCQAARRACSVNRWKEWVPGWYAVVGGAVGAFGSKPPRVWSGPGKAFLRMFVSVRLSKQHSSWRKKFSDVPAWMFQVEVSTPGGLTALLCMTVQGSMFPPSCCSAVPWALFHGGSWVFMGSCGGAKAKEHEPHPHITSCRREGPVSAVQPGTKKRVDFDPNWQPVMPHWKASCRQGPKGWAEVRKRGGRREDAVQWRSVMCEAARVAGGKACPRHPGKRSTAARESAQGKGGWNRAAEPIRSRSRKAPN